MKTRYFIFNISRNSSGQKGRQKHKALPNRDKKYAQETVWSTWERSRSRWATSLLRRRSGYSRPSRSKATVEGELTKKGDFNIILFLLASRTWQLLRVPLSGDSPILVHLAFGSSLKLLALSLACSCANTLCTWLAFASPFSIKLSCWSLKCSF